MAMTPERAVPLVSIVVPCFNAGDTLPETLESARAVDYPAVEIIVCDDGSTDPLTLQVLADLEDDVRVVRQENAGLPAARNAAIAAARGTYVFPLDADDKIHQDYARAAVEVFEADPQIGIVHARVLRFGDAQGEVGYDDFSIGKLLNHNMIHQLSWFRRADWEALGGYDEKLRDGREDHEFWIRIVSTGRTVVKLDELYSIYRIPSHIDEPHDDPRQARTHLRRDLPQQRRLLPRAHRGILHRAVRRARATRALVAALRQGRRPHRESSPRVRRGPPPRGDSPPRPPPLTVAHV